MPDSFVFSVTLFIFIDDDKSPNNLMPLPSTIGISERYILVNKLLSIKDEAKLLPPTSHKSFIFFFWRLYTLLLACSQLANYSLQLVIFYFLNIPKLAYHHKATDRSRQSFLMFYDLLQPHSRSTSIHCTQYLP